MTVDQTKKIINILSKKWLINKKKFILEIVDFLDKKTNKKLSFYNGFECSFVRGDRDSIRLLHLNFWRTNSSSQEIKRIIHKREESLKTVFQKISQEFNCQYNINLLQKLFQFNRQNSLWPIQFGLGYQKLGPKLKVYLSVNGDRFPLKKLCRGFNLNYQVLGKKFKNKKFDTIAIDFSPDKDYCFKFYPLVTINKGLLCRVDKGSRVASIKIWLRFPTGLFIDDERINKFIRLPALIHKIIKDNNFKIHYLCEENGKKGIYFR